MQSYLEMLRHIMNNGEDRSDRTGTGTRGVFGYEWRHNMEDGFPLLTTKKLHTRSIIHELLWFLNGETNIRYLKDNKVTIWDEWADENGELGPVYGAQWRQFFGSPHPEGDQIQVLMEQLKNNPFSRRHIVTAWNPLEINQMALPPCHMIWQCFVSNDKKLSLKMFQRSADTFLGVPFNIASYGLLLCMIAHVLGYGRGDLIITFGDLHIYNNHFDQVSEQRMREPRKLPELKFSREVKSIFDFKYEDFVFEGYDPHPTIKAEISK